MKTVDQIHNEQLEVLRMFLFFYLLTSNVIIKYNWLWSLNTCCALYRSSGTLAYLLYHVVDVLVLPALFEKVCELICKPVDIALLIYSSHRLESKKLSILVLV